MASSQYNTGGKTTLIKDRCDVEVEYVMDKTQVPWPSDSPYNTTAYGVRSTSKGTHTPILIDEKSEIFIEHHTVACALNMKFVLTFATFDNACKAFETIQSRYKGSLVQIPYDLTFSYPVSMGMYGFLMAVKNAKKDYQNKTLMDYINDMKKTEISFDVRKSQLTEEKADRELMIRCKQLKCLSQLTMEQKEPDVGLVDNLPDSYSISFEMVIQFGRPTIVAVHTPVSVDNTTLPLALFENNKMDYHNNPQAVGVYQDLTCSEFMRRSYGNFGVAQQIIRLPVYDDWLCVDAQFAFYQYRPFIIAHFTLDGPVTTFNIKRLDDVQLHPIVQAMMREMGNAVFQYGGLFTIGVYAGNMRMDPTLLSLDEDLNLTVRSSRGDKVYHLVISETTSLHNMSVEWDHLLIKYRYFFPMSIERNINSLIKKRYFYIGTDNAFLQLVNRLMKNGRVKSILKTMVDLGEYTQEIYSYTQNPSQLADFLLYTESMRKDYTVPTGDDDVSLVVQEYYATQASVDGRSLFVAFVEQCLIQGHLTLNTIPKQYLEPNQAVYPYYSGQGGYYGFNTPIRVINYTFDT
jgi:hypothetical protein